jgi:ATP-binding cassette subfamily G (WHITE) protein 2 (SNQ2)
MGFGQGDEGIGGNFFQLLVVIFIELFGVSLGQVIAALSPSIRVGEFFAIFSRILWEIRLQHFSILSSH